MLLLGAGREDFAWTGELPATEVEGVRRVEAGDDLSCEDLGWDGLGPGLGAPKKAARVACLALGMGMSAMENVTRRRRPAKRGDLRLGRLLGHGA